MENRRLKVRPSARNSEPSTGMTGSVAKELTSDENVRGDVAKDREKEPRVGLGFRPHKESGSSDLIRKG